MNTKLIPYLKLARLSNSPTVASNVLTGSALAGILTPNLIVFWLIIAMIAFYSAGMYLNDLVDLNYDKKHNPDRLLPKGAVKPSHAAIIMTILFTFGSILLWRIGTGVFLAGLALIILIGIYNLWHKQNPISPLLMAGCRVLVYAIAFFAFAQSLNNTVFLVGFFLVLYMIGLTYVAKKGARGKIIALLIAGISLYDAFILSIIGSIPGAILATICFITTLYLQKYIKGA